MMNLNNKVIVVTGAGSGIGRALALQLTDLGATLALNDWNKSSLDETLHLVKQAGGFPIGQAYDVSDRAAHEAFAKQVHRAYGHIDGLINNAGLTVFPSSIAKTDPIDFQKVVDVNLWGVVHGTQVFLPYLKQQEEGFIANMSSLLGLVGYAGQGAYVTTKFAVRGFTETLRQELYRSHINVLSIHPGPVRTQLTRHIQHEDQEAVNKLADLFEAACRTTPEGAAKLIIKAIRRKRTRLVFGRFTRELDWLARLFPGNYHRFHPSNFRPGRLIDKMKTRIGQARKAAKEEVTN